MTTPTSSNNVLSTKNLTTSMENSELHDAIRSRIAETLSLSADEAAAITGSTTAFEVVKWDSANHMRLVVALEKQFNVSFSDDEIVLLASVDAIVKALKARGIG